MKQRLGHVTNSSSSSFLISKKFLNSNQIEAIWKHSKLGKMLGLSYPEEEWDIEESEHFISGETYMDNFSMYEFLNIIGATGVVWDEDESAIEAERHLYSNTRLSENEAEVPEWVYLLKQITD